MLLNMFLLLLSFLCIQIELFCSHVLRDLSVFVVKLKSKKFIYFSDRYLCVIKNQEKNKILKN